MRARVMYTMGSLVRDREEELDWMVREAERSTSEVLREGQCIGDFLRHPDRVYRTDTHIGWVVSHPEAGNIQETWRSALERSKPDEDSAIVVGPVEMLPAGSMIVSVRVAKHVDTPIVLEESRHLEQLLTWKVPILERGPWKEGDMETAWEIYFEKNGFSPYARCANDKCGEGPPLVTVRIPESHCIPGLATGSGVRGNLLRQVVPVCRPQQIAIQRRELCAFCAQCWRFTDFRTNRAVVGDTGFMDKLNIFAGKRAKPEDGGLRGQLTAGEWQAYVMSRLRNGKSPGPDRYQNELLKTMTDNELEILRIWANEVLCGKRQMTEDDLNGTISLLHKGGDTLNLPSDFRPVVLLNSINQLISHVINHRLQNIVERAGILEAGQGGYRRGRSTDVNMRKIEQITMAAQRSKSRFLRVDVDFRNAYNAMSQPALWCMLRKFNIPDVDFLETIYEHATVRLAPNDQSSATITFNTGVCQGSVLSPLLFILFINALARTLTAIGKQHGIAHGMEGIEQFNNLMFCDDMSLFAQTRQGMQQLLNGVEEFEEWSGIRVNIKKTMVMAVDGDKKRREGRIEVKYRGKRLRQLESHEACRYLGFWATPNGDFTRTKEIVFQRTKEAIELIRHHPYSPEMAMQIFISKGVGNFRYSAAVVPWLEHELEQLQDLWTTGFRVAWHLGSFTAKAPFVLPAECGGLELVIPKAIMAHALTGHLQRCLLHKDVVRNMMIAELEKAKAFSLCEDFQDMWEEMDLWPWSEVQGNVWLRLAKCMRDLRMELELPPSIDNPDAGSIGWARATRTLRLAYRRACVIGGKCAMNLQPGQGEVRWLDEMWRGNGGLPTHWSMEMEQWRTLQEGIEAFWQAGRKLWQAGHSKIATVERRQVKCGPKVPKGLRATDDTDGQQNTRMIIPRGLAGIREGCRWKFQKFLDLVDWKGALTVSMLKSGQRSTDLTREKCVWCEKVKFKCSPCLNAQCSRAAKVLEWLEQMPGGSCMTQRETWNVAEAAKRVGEWGTRPEGAEWQDVTVHMRFQPEIVVNGVRRWLKEETESSGPGVQVRERSLRCAQAMVRLWPKIVAGLHPERGREWRDRLAEIAALIDQRSCRGMCYNVAHSGCEAGEQVDAKWCVDMQRSLAKLCDRCGRCQIKHTGRCKQCGWTHCMQCVGNESRCKGCDGGLDYRCDIPHGPWQPKRKVGQRLGRNVHNMGRFFVDRVTKARYREVPDPERLPVDRRIEFQAWVSGWQSAERRENVRRLLEKSDDQLIAATALCSDKMMLFLPQMLFPESSDRVGFGEKGW